MVLWGLFFDQNQGFLLHNPVNLIGILAIGWMYRFNRAFTLSWALIFFSLIVPNALHPAWYGGWSFSGRFSWSASMVFCVPTIFGLLQIARWKKKIFYGIVGCGVSLQMYFFYIYAFLMVRLHNFPPKTPFYSYSIFYYPIHSWLPMLYNADMAYSYFPNYAFFILIGALF